MTFVLLTAIALAAPAGVTTPHPEPAKESGGAPDCLLTPHFAGDALYTGAVSDQDIPLKAITSCTIKKARAVHIAPENDTGARFPAILSPDSGGFYVLTIGRTIPKDQWARAGSFWQIYDITSHDQIASLSITTQYIAPTLTAVQVVYKTKAEPSAIEPGRGGPPPTDRDRTSTKQSAIEPRIVRFLNNAMTRAREADPHASYKDAHVVPAQESAVEIRNIAEFSGMRDFPTQSRTVDTETEVWKVNPKQISGLAVENGGSGSSGCKNDGHEDCIEDISAIGFQMRRESEQPLFVDLYYSRSRAGESSVRRMRIQVQIAERARRSSVPFPLVSHAYVQCSTNRRPSHPTFDIAEDGQTLAVNDYVIDRDDCSIVVPTHRIDAQINQELGLGVIERQTCPWYPVRRYKKTHNASGVKSDKDSRAAHEPGDVKSDKDSRAARQPGAVKSGKKEKLGGTERECIEQSIPPYASLVRLAPPTKADQGHDTEAPYQDLERVRALLGPQTLVYQVTQERTKERTSPERLVAFDLTAADVRIPLEFGKKNPNEAEEFEIRFETQAQADGDSSPGAGEQRRNSFCGNPTRCFLAHVRSKGRFGVAHARGTRGSNSVRVFATIPLDFVAFRFPPSGRAATSSADSNIAQITTLNTGLLLAIEPWNYITNRNMFALPFRFLFGGMVHRWQQGKFEPSMFTGGALALPLFKGLDANDRVSFDLTLSAGWELSLIRSASAASWRDDFRSRNHFVIAVGLNVFALFSPKTATK